MLFMDECENVNVSVRVSVGEGTLSSTFSVMMPPIPSYAVRKYTDANIELLHGSKYHILSCDHLNWD